MTLTDDLVVKIHAAMQQAGGVATDAGKILGLPPKKIHQYIHDNADLRARWATSKHNPVAPVEAETLSRPPVRPLSNDMILAEKIKEEDNMVKGGLKNMGLSEEAVTLALSLQQFQRRHFARAVELIGGGITKAFLDAMMDVEKIRNQLDSGELAPEREFMLRTDRTNLLEIMGKFFDRANKASMTQAIIKHKLQNEGGNGKPAKPGFGTLVKATNVQIVQRSERPELPEGE